MAGSASPVSYAVPLVVDMDGTLLLTDSLLESLLAAFRQHPLVLLRLPLWYLLGKAQLKQRLAAAAALDTASLPLNAPLLQYLQNQAAQGRCLVLASGADQSIARAVAERCGFFDTVLASDGKTNLSGTAKRYSLLARYGERGFDYVGNAAQDRPVWAVARAALLVQPSRQLLEQVRAQTPVRKVFAGSSPRLADYASAMRVQHWFKSLLLVLPVLLGHAGMDPAAGLHLALAIASFCLAASGVYCLNDLLDLATDRQHPYKRSRALASGAMPIRHALLLLSGLWLASALLALLLAPGFLMVLGVYVALMLAYCLRLRNMALVDALALAAGYDLRILAGAVATGVTVSSWLLLCSSCLFFGLALLKRYAEMVVLASRPQHSGPVRGYPQSWARQLALLGLAAGAASVVLLLLYPLLGPLRQQPWPFWLAGTMLLLWMGHMWDMAHHGKIQVDPVAYALHDPLSRLFGLLTVLLLLVQA